MEVTCPRRDASLLPRPAVHAGRKRAAWLTA